MTQITKQAATDYVTSYHAKFDEAVKITAIEPCREAGLEEALDVWVFTPAGGPLRWTVWDENGTVYGEC